MKRKVFIATLLAIFAVVSTLNVVAQDRKEYRQQQRLKAVTLEEDQIKSMLAKQSFYFQANQISWTTSPQVQDIMLNQTAYGIWAYPGNLNVYLPIYGMSEMEVTPRLQHSLDFSTSRYSYNVSPNFDNTKWTITINATNPMTLGQYSFIIVVDYQGNGTLTINSPLMSEAIFTGTIFAQ